MTYLLSFVIILTIRGEIASLIALRTECKKVSGYVREIANYSKDSNILK